MEKEVNSYDGKRDFMESVESRLSFIKRHLWFLVLLPTLFGFTHQAVRLILFDPVFIYFFSASQMLIDGIYVIVYLAICAIVALITVFFIKLITGGYGSKLKMIKQNYREGDKYFKRIAILTLAALVVLIGIISYFAIQVNKYLWLGILAIAIYPAFAGCMLYLSFTAKGKESSSMSRLAFYLSVLGIYIISFMPIKTVYYSSKEQIAPYVNEVLKNQHFQVKYMNDKYIFIHLADSSINTAIDLDIIRHTHK